MDIVGQILALYKRLKGERAERESRWREYYNAYFLRANRILPVPKYEWESTFISSKFFSVVEKFVNIIRRSLIQSGEFFKISGTKKYEKISKSLQKLVSYYLSSYDFLDAFEQAVRYGAITSEIIIRIDWEEYIDETPYGTFIVSKPFFKAVSPFDIVFDKYERFCIQNYYLDLLVVKKLQEMGIWNSFPLKSYHTIEPEKLEGTAVPPSGYPEGMCLVKEFWGNLYTEQGIVPNLHVIIVNDEHVAKMEHFSYLHNSLPFVRAVLFEGFEFKDGISIMDVIYEFAKSLSFVSRQIENNIVISSSAIIEIDKTRIDQGIIEHIKEKGLSPFQIVFKTGPDELIRTQKYTEFNPNVLPYIQYLNMEIQNVSGLTEFLEGLPTSRGRPTAREIMLKTNQSITMMDNLTTKIEHKILKETIWKLLLLIIQCENTQKIAEILDEDEFKEFSSYDKMQLAQLIREKLAISVSGITEVIHRREKLQQLIDFMSIISSTQLPINWEYILTKFAYLLDFDPHKILNIPSEEEKQAQQEMFKMFAKLLINLPPEERKHMLELAEKLPIEIIISALQELAQERQERGIQ